MEQQLGAIKQVNVGTVSELSPSLCNERPHLAWGCEAPPGGTQASHAAGPVEGAVTPL